MEDQHNNAYCTEMVEGGIHWWASVLVGVKHWILINGC